MLPIFQESHFSKLQTLGNVSLKERSITSQDILFKPILSLLGTLTQSYQLVRRTEIEKKDLIVNYSILNRKLETAVLKLSTNLPALIGQIHGHEIIKNTELEKLPLDIAIEGWIRYAESSKNAKVPLQLIKRIQQLLMFINERAVVEDSPDHMVEFAETVMHRVHELEPGQSYLIEGGKTDDRNIPHPVVFEFTKRENDNYNLIVYLVGQADPLKRTTFKYRDKTWFNPMVRYENIPPHALFFYDTPENLQNILKRNEHDFFPPGIKDIQPDFFQTIIGTKQAPDLEIDYLSLMLEHLNPYRVTDPVHEVLFDEVPFIAQSDSDCDAWRLGKTLAIRAMGKEEYKKLIFEIKFRSLVEGYQVSKELLEQDSEEGEVLHTLFKKAATNLLKTLCLKSIKQKATAEDLVVERATLLDLMDRLEHAHQKVVSKRKAMAIPFSLDLYAVDEGTKERVLLLTDLANNIAKEEDKKMPPPVNIIGVHSFTLPPVEQFAAKVQAYIETSPSDKKVKALEIEQLVDLLPIPSVENAYWEALPEQDLPKVMGCLRRLLIDYDLSVLEEKCTTPKQANTVFALYALLHHMAIKVDHEKQLGNHDLATKLHAYPIYFPGFECDKDPYLMYISSADFERRQAITQYFNRLYANASFSEPLFDFASTPKKVDHRSLSGHLQWFMALASNYPELDIKGEFEVDPIAAMLRDLTAYGEQKENGFVKAGLEYIPILFHAALIAHQFASHAYMRGSRKRNAGVFVYKTRSGTLKLAYYLGEKANAFGRESSSDSRKMHPKLDKKSNKWLSTHVWNSRMKIANTTQQEADALEYGDDLLRKACEPQLYPYKLLSHFSQNIVNFASSSQQTIFEIQFFRSVAFTETEEGLKGSKGYARTALFPLKEEITNHHFKEQCHHFIQQGIDCYHLRQPAMRPQIFPLLFFFRFSICLNHFIRAQEFLDPIPYLTAILNRDDLNEEEKSAVNLHLVASCLLQGKKLSQKEKEQLLMAWIEYKNLPLPLNKAIPHLEKEVENGLYMQMKEAENFPDDLYRNIFAITLQQLGLEKILEECPIERIDPFQIKAHLPDGKYWILNFLTAQLMNETGVLQRIEAPYWKDYIGFTRNFEKIPTSFMQIGDVTYFQDHLSTKYRLIGDNTDKGLQKNIDGIWYQYMVPKELTKRGIPGSLISHHTHWLATSPSLYPLIIFDEDTGKQAARVSAKGEIVRKGALLHGIVQDAVLSKFEDADHLLFVLKEQVLSSFHFTRYLSVNGEPLQFIVENGKAIYSSNRKYFLSDIQSKHHLGNLEQYLLLAHQEDGRQKILVPFRLISKYHPLTSRHEINRAERQLSAFDEVFNIKIDKHFTYIEYDLIGEKIIPLSQEGGFFLAYLALSKREYAKALELIKGMDFRETLNKNSFTAIEGIFGLTDPRQDPSVEAAAIALHAWALMVMIQKRCHIEGKPFEYANALRDWSLHISESVVTYYNHSHELAYGLHLSEQQKGYLPLRSRTSYVSLYATPADDPMEAFVDSSSDKEIFSCSKKFIESYLMAKLGSKAQRDRLAFILKTKGKKYVNNDDKAWNCLQYALKNPEPDARQNALSIIPRFSRNEEDETPNFRKMDEYQIESFFNSLANKIQRQVENYERSLPSLTREEPYLGATPSWPFAAQLPAEKQIFPVNMPLKLSFSAGSTDRLIISDLFSKHFSELEKPESSDEPINFDYRKEWLSESEMAFAKAFKNDLEDFQVDYILGIDKNDQDPLFAIKEEELLRDELNTAIGVLKGELANLESALLELANQKSEDSLPLKLKIEASFAKELSLKDLVRLFLQGDKQRFYEANPQLKNSQLIETIAKSYRLKPHPDLVVDCLYDLIAFYMRKSVFVTQLKRAEKLCGEIEEIKDEKSLTRFLKVQKLARELESAKAKPCYEDINYPIFLVFEYLSGFTLRPQQAELLVKLLEIDERKKTYKNKIVEMIMGGGKTTVISVILLQLAARPGRLSIFVVPSSLYTTVSHDLRKALRDYFEQDMEEMEVSRDNLSLAVCLDIEQRLHKAIRRGDFLLVKAESVQCLELEFLNLIYAASKKQWANLSDILLRIDCLRRILLLLREKGDALFDEVDILLNVVQEVNFPIGSENKVDMIRVDLIREIFSIMLSENAPIKDQTVNLRELIGLEANRQTLLSLEDLHGVVAKAVAWHLAYHFEALFLVNRPEFHDSFYRYISGTMSKEIQQIHLRGATPEEESTFSSEMVNDLNFLEFVHSASSAKDSKEREMASLVALTKHMFQAVFPITLQKKGNQHYGLSGEKPGEKRPFLAVDTPSSNVFGYQWEAVAYYFQTALQVGIDEQQIMQVAKNYSIQAEYYSKRYNVSLNEAPESKEFKVLTGVDLTEIHQPGRLQEAASHLRRNPHALLIFESESILQHVGYYPERLTSTSHCLPRMFSSVRGMAAITWNRPCYDSSLTGSFVTDDGTEGRIAAKVFSDIASNKNNSVHLIQNTNIHQMLHELLDNHPKKAQVKMLMDAGALFKNYKNVEVAMALRDYLKMPILFFTRDIAKEQKTPDTLALLKVKSNNPVLIGGSRLEDIERMGLDVGDYFVFLDERHVTGTDLPMPPDAFGFMTIDENMLRRTFFQTILRLRDYFLTQSVEFIIPQYLIKDFFPIENQNEQLKLLLNSLLISIKNQAINKAIQFFKSRKQAIDNVPRQFLLNQLLPRGLDLKEIKDTFLPFERAIVAYQSNELYHQFGNLEFPVDSIQSLRNYKERKLATFASEKIDKNLITKLSDQMDEIVRAAASSPYLPKEVIELGSEELGMEFDILMEVAQEIQVNLEQNIEIQQDIDIELLQELRLYEQGKSDAKRPEDQWNEEMVMAFLEKMKAGQSYFSLVSDAKRGVDLEVFPLYMIFSDSHYKYRRDFKGVFKKNILVTTSWVYSTEQTFSAFHKMQRPADSLLVVKTGKGYQGIVLSQNECKQFKEILESLYQKEASLKKHCWLVQSTGDLFAGATPFPENKETAAILLQCNAFDGKIDYLDMHPVETDDWLYENLGSERKLDFLKLCIARHIKQKKIFFNSELFNPLSSSKTQNNHIRKGIERFSSMEKNEIQQLTEEDKNILSLLSPTQINLIKPEQAAWLLPYQIGQLKEKNLIQAVQEKNLLHLRLEQIPHIGPQQVAWFKTSIIKTQRIPIALAPYMPDEQFKLISPDQISQIEDPKTFDRLSHSQLAYVKGSQVKKGLVKAEHVPYLRRKGAIQALDPSLTQYVEPTLRERYLN